MSLKKQIEKDPDEVAPELKREPELARQRILAAARFFEQHFDPDGDPMTVRGELLSQKYSEVTLYDTNKLRRFGKRDVVEGELVDD